ncbi:MAG: YbaK/EbsC family protein [Treponema sp.]|jgi:prolyl-tRNA editing enzyme YbaK/EbsC (Cys-tRNA(Pro) deacylase)|nr:YbaK/EbsC family protein [Treponema sp.]
MAIEKVRAHLKTWGREADIIELDASTATVAEAAAALGVIPARIAKSISLKTPESAASSAPAIPPGEVSRETFPGPAFIVVTAGDARLDNKKFKARFGFKAKMLTPEEALEYTGHAVGGVCPFGLPSGIAVYLDESMKRFTAVFPACGSGNSAIELTLAELETYSRTAGWVDVCRQDPA